MKTFSNPGVHAYLASTSQPNYCDLVTFTLLNGTVLRYAMYDDNVQFGGHTFKGDLAGDHPRLKRGTRQGQTGAQVSTLDIEIYPRDSDVIGPISFLQAVGQGLLDGATFELDRVFMPVPPVVLGGCIDFYGYAGQAVVGDTSIELEVQDPFVLLNIQLPRNLYQAQCTYILYEPNTCKAVQADFTDAGVVASATRRQIGFSSSRPDGYFTLGYVKFTSGTLAGLSYSVQSDTTGVVNVIPPMLVAPAPGDTFNVSAGCDHSLATCIAKFANVSNFHGFPFIPAPETTL